MKRELLRPREILASVLDISPAFLRERGLRGLLLDLDNTLIPYGSYEERPEVQRWVAALHGAGTQLYLLSNATEKRAQFWLEKLGFAGVGMAGKPWPHSYRRALAQLDLSAEQTGMVGDQLFTDVLGGNLAGLYTIIVHPLADNALPHTRLARRLEHAVMRRYGHDWSPPERRP